MKETFKYQYINCKSALNKINSFLPYHYDLNIYRGCEHHCIYCFAQYSHRYLEDNDFFHHIYVKENIVETLEKKLQSRSWKRDVINLGGVTDSYQPAEKKFQIMPKILKLLIKYKTPAIISTKSNLIVRDIELLSKLNEVAGLQIAFTITTIDQNLATEIEPNASTVKERFEAIKMLKEAGLTVGIHLMPMIPYITATRSNLSAIFALANKYHVDYMITSMLNLKGNTRNYFFEFIKKYHSTYYDRLWKLYHDKEKKKIYKQQLTELINNLTEEYHICINYHKFVPKETETQLCLF